MADVAPDPDLVSIGDAAVLLGISLRTAYDLAARDELPGAVKVGGRWRVSLVKYRRAVHGEETK